MRWIGLRRRPWARRAGAGRDFGLWLEGLVLLVLIVQAARLLWVLLVPVGQYGDWRAREPMVISADARQALFAGFDPFFRVSGSAVDGATHQVTSLPLQLYGIRLNEGSGQGAAIIANGNGEQQNYAVGDEIAPGVTLKAVHFDHVVISRSGVNENLFIDQSQQAQSPQITPATPDVGDDAAAGQAEGPPSEPSAESAAPPPSDAIMKGIDFVPHLERGRVTGVVVRPANDGKGFVRAGFRPGDIITQVNGQPITSSADLTALRRDIRPGARISLTVERGGTTVPIALLLPDYP